MYDFNIEFSMTKTIVYAALISGIAAMMILYGTANAIPAVDLDFVWDPADISSDPANLIAISGSFSRVGLVSDTTTDVKGEISIGLTEAESNKSVTTVTTNPGSSTIITTVEAHSHEVVKKNPDGIIFIDGEEFRFKFKTSCCLVTVLDSTEEFTGPNFSQTSDLQSITIPGTVQLYNGKEKVLEGFGTIRSESSATSTGVAIVTFITKSLEAEIIGEDGLFSLKLFLLQRITEPNIKPFEGTVGTAFTINDPFGRLIPNAVVVFTLIGDDVCTQGTTVGGLTVSGDGTTASGTVPASLSSVVHGVTVHAADQCNASILPFTLQFVVT